MKTILKAIPLLAVALVVLIWSPSMSEDADAAVGDTFDVGEIRYEITSESPNEVSVKEYIGDSTILELTIPKTVVNNSVTYDVTGAFSDAFNNATALKTITLNADVDFYEYYYDDCNALEKFHVATDHSTVMSIDGIVFSKDKTTILMYPEARPGAEYTLPKEVENIGDYAFEDNTNLERLLFSSKDVTEFMMGEEPFYGTSLTFGDAVDGYSVAFHTNSTFDNPLTDADISGLSGAAIYAKWMNEYKVSFDALGMATNPSQKDVVFGSEYGELPTVSKEGFTFEGWFTGSNVQILPTTIVDISEDITLHALWTVTIDKVQYRVTSAPAADVPGEVTLFNVDDTLTELVIPASITVGTETYAVTDLDWYAFVYATDLKTITLNSDIEFDESDYDYCVALEEFHVATDHSTVMSIDGIVFSKDKTTILMYPEARPGAEYTLPKEVENMGDYAFEDNTNLERLLFSSKDVTEFMMGEEPFCGTSLTFGDAVDGYSVAFHTNSTFDNPLTDADISGLMGATIYAKWSVEQYTITFDSAGGNDVTSITQDYGTAVTSPADPTRTGYTFSGWSPAVPTTMPAENVTRVAQWTAIDYVVTFDPNGGTVDSTTKTVNYGFGYGELPTPTKAGNNFIGWFTASDDSGVKINSDTAVLSAENHTLYAKWNPISDDGEGMNIGLIIGGVVAVIALAGAGVFLFMRSRP